MSGIPEKMPFNDITIWHLRLLDFYHSRLPHYLPVYVKSIRKATNRFRTSILRKRNMKFYKQGEWPVSRKEFKDLVNQMVGFMGMIDSTVQTIEVDYIQVSNDVRNLVITHYSFWEPSVCQSCDHMVEFVMEGMKEAEIKPNPFLFKSWLDITPTIMKPLVWADEVLTYINDDPRLLYVDLDTAKLFTYLRDQKLNVIENVSRIRGEKLLAEGRTMRPEELNVNALLSDFLAEAKATEWDFIQDQIQKAAALNL